MNVKDTRASAIPHFLSVTELAGDEVSREDIERLCDRYFWAGAHCAGKDVLEVACGTGQGLGYLGQRAKSLLAGDLSEAMVNRARHAYGERVNLLVFDALNMPFRDGSRDLIVILEALYYLPDVDAFITECKRILRPSGSILIATANKDLFAFGASPYSSEYLGVVELRSRLERLGFTVTCFGNTRVDATCVRARLLRLMKKALVSSALMPKTMAGKKLLKRLAFGRLETMPAEIDEGTSRYHAPVPLTTCRPDREHKIIYCVAALRQSPAGPAQKA